MAGSRRENYLPEEVLRNYFHAKDENRPALLDRVFTPSAELLIRNNSANIQFPATTRGRAAIAEVLVRSFALAYENVHSFYLERPTDAVREFTCSWLVGMSERTSGQPRVGCGIYAWSFEATPPHMATSLVICIEAMQVLPSRQSEAVLTWLSSLSYPWSSPSLALRDIPRVEELAPIERFLKGHRAIA